MSRMQNILDKAEREGAVLRIRPVPDQDAIAAVDTTVAVMEPASPTPAVHAIPRTASPGRVDRSLVSALAPDSPPARQYRGLCTRIMHADQGAAVKVIMITSPGSGEGKSVTAANLALTMAREYPKPTVLVDANLRAPKIHQMLGLPEGPGLIDVLAGRIALVDALTFVDPLGITVLQAGSGSEHPAELLSTPTIRRTIDALRGQFDRVVIDTPAALPMVDMGLLEPLADRIVLVVRSGVTPKASIQDALATIDSSRLLGVVLNEAE